MRIPLLGLRHVCAVIGLGFVAGCPCMSVMVDAGSDTAIEAGGSVTLNATVSGDDGSVTYAWQPAESLSDAGSSMPTASPTETTVYTVTVTTCEMSFTDTVTVTVTATESTEERALPTADAGADQTLVVEDVDGVATVRLDAGLSVDRDGTIRSYRWLENGALIATGVSPSVELSVGTHTITLEILDDQQRVSIDTVVISVGVPPIANAGVDQTAVDIDLSGFENVDLDGSASEDADGTIASFSWTVDGVEISADESPMDVVLAVGDHNVTLTVTDEDGLSATDNVRVVVVVPGAPIALAGLDQFLRDDGNNGTESVTLDGSGSRADSTIASYRWLENGQEIAVGVGPTVILSTGVHTITLEITDGAGRTATDIVVITVSALIAPIANAGVDREEVDLDNDGNHDVVLNAGGSTDADGTIVAYRWSEGSTQLAMTASATVSLAQGAHIIDLLVTDNDGITGVDSVTINVVPPPPLSADAGVDRMVAAEASGGVYTGRAVTLTGSAAGGTPPYVYAWAEGATNLGGTQSITATLTVGIHDIDLTVTDANTGSVTDSLRVSVHVPSTTSDGLPDRTMCGSFVGVCTGDEDNLAVNVEALTIDTVMQQITILEMEPQCVFDNQAPFPEFTTVPHKILIQRTGSAGPEQVQFSSLTSGGCATCLISWSEGGIVFSTEPGPLTLLSADTYVITASVTDDQDTETSEAIVIVNPPANAVLAGATSSEYFVFGVTDVTLTAVGMGGTEPYTYSWVPVDGLTDATAAVTQLTIGAVDTYTVTVTDANGNSDTARVVLALDCLAN